MNKMIVAVFGTEPAAYEGLRALNELHKDGDITLYASAVVARNSSGAVNVKQSSDGGPVGTAIGLLAGGLVGLLAGPAGAAAGAAAGGLTGMIFDLDKTGVNLTLLDDVSKTLGPGKAAVLAEVQESWVTPVDTRMEKLGGVVFRRPRSEVVEDQLVRDSAVLKTELKHLREEFSQATKETKAAVRSQIGAAQNRVKAMQVRLKATVEEETKEAGARIHAVQDQMKQAGDRQKKQIQKRIAEVKAHHTVRSAKLKQAGKLVKEALSL